VTNEEDEEMREIKFRAWVRTSPSTSRKMIRVKGIDWGSNYITDNATHGRCSIIGNVLMQYTGLKDKNGVEIYEGDIVLINHMGMRGIYSTHEDVRFQDGVFEVWGHNSLRGCHTICEVIGNIYEHPHLLTSDVSEPSIR
jgi:hypothetical protein